MNPEIKAKWIEALRSGKYSQGRGRLRREDHTFCCLGVLCDIYDPSKWMSNEEWRWFYDDGIGALPLAVAEVARIDDWNQNRLASMNDSGKTFDEIADYIEEHL